MRRGLEVVLENGRGKAWESCAGLAHCKLNGFDEFGMRRGAPEVSLLPSAFNEAKTLAA